MNTRTAISVALFLLSAGWLVSCKKSSNNNSAPSNPNLLKWYIVNSTQTTYGGIDTTTFTYDGQNRVLTEITSNGIDLAFTYGSSESFSTNLYNSGLFNIHELFLLDGSSLVDSTFQYNESNDTTTEAYTYSGTLATSLSQYNYSSFTGSSIYQLDLYTYDNNGNMIKDVQSDGNGSVSLTTVYTYTDSLLNYSMSPPYLPAQSKNLPATLTETDDYGNQEGAIKFSYVLDSTKRVILETDSISNAEVIVKTFVYF